MHLLILVRHIFRRMPHGSMRLIAQHQLAVCRTRCLRISNRQITTITVTFQRIRHHQFRQPHVLHRTGIVLVTQDLTRRTPHRTGNPHRLVVRRIVRLDGITKHTFHTNGIHSHVVTLAVIDRRERSIRISRNRNHRIHHITTLRIAGCTHARKREYIKHK